MNSAFLFPGQGSQSIGMLSALAAESETVAATYAEASEALGFDLWNLTQEGPDEQLNQTENTQPAVLAGDIAVWRVWGEQGGFSPTHFAGHSLGEYAALTAAGSLSFSDAIKLVALRGRLMQTATPAGVGAMAAIIGLEDEQLEAVCAAAAQDQIVSCANYNSPGQVVIAGHREAVDRACEGAKEAGARRALPLAVSVPSHCMLMREAADELLAALEGIEISAPDRPIVHNADVQVHAQPDSIRAVLAKQLWQPVRWTQTVSALAAMGCGQFAECGPGKVLSGLNKRINRQLPVTALTDTAAMQNLIEEMS